MDHNDKRNTSVPLGTFGQENQENHESLENSPENRAREFVSDELEALAALQPDERLDPTIPRFRIDNTEVNPRPRVRTLLGVPAFDFPLDGRPEPENITASIVDALENEVRIDIDLDADPDAAEVTMVTDSDVVPLPDSVPPPSADTGPRLIEVAPSELEVVSEPIGVAPAAAAQPAQTSTPASVSPAALSSLAPREVQRPRTQAPAKPADSTSRVGLLLVAAALVLAAGGWLLTAGSFRRATITEAPAAPQTSQPMAVSQPLADTPEPAHPQPSAAEAVATAPAVQPPAEAVTPAPTPASAEHKLSGTAGKKPSLTASSRNLRVKRTQPAPAPTGDMPETPARGVVLQRLESVRSSVQACAAGRSGIADLDITIAHTGAVMHVLVGGDFAGTTQGSCIARAVREARFPSFKQERFRLLYPYAI